MEYKRNTAKMYGEQGRKQREIAEITEETEPLPRLQERSRKDEAACVQREVCLKNLNS